MVPAAERHCELIADLATQCRRLGKAQMMRISRASTADLAADTIARSIEAVMRRLVGQDRY